MNGVVKGLDRKVISAATGMLPRNGMHKSAEPMIWSPGIMTKIPTSRPMATPRGTERRVKRQNSL